jgi:hypothetical protein
MSFKKWFPSYLWYSGILMQALLVIMGIHSLVAAFDRRPAHTLHTRLFEKLNEQEFCNSTFAGQEFDWKEPKALHADLKSDRAEIEKFVYMNRGSVGRTADGYHVYRLELQATVKDLGTNEVIQFPPRHERLVEVDARNRIVACHPDMNARNLHLDHLQEIRSVACEKPGWKRRQLCDGGTDRCYPMTLCEKGS